MWMNFHSLSWNSKHICHFVFLILSHNICTIVTKCTSWLHRIRSVLRRHNFWSYLIFLHTGILGLFYDLWLVKFTLQNIVCIWIETIWCVQRLDLLNRRLHLHLLLLELWFLFLILALGLYFFFCFYMTCFCRDYRSRYRYGMTIFFIINWARLRSFVINPLVCLRLTFLNDDWHSYFFNFK